MKKNCHGCNVEKDTSVKEIYPYPEDGLTDDPIDPFMTLDCQLGLGLRDETDWRVVSVCHDCFHKLDPDMWINADGWRSIQPFTPFEQLPRLYSEQ